MLRHTLGRPRTLSSGAAIDRGSDAHDSAEGAQRNDCGRQRASLASGQVPVEKVGFAEALLEEAKAFGDGGVAPAMMARIEDVDLKNVAGLGSADENRSGERVNAVAVDGKQVGERGAAFDLAAAGLDALEVNSVAGSDLEARRQSAVPAGMGGLGNQRMLGHVTPASKRTLPLPRAATRCSGVRSASIGGYFTMGF